MLHFIRMLFDLPFITEKNIISTLKIFTDTQSRELLTN